MVSPSGSVVWSRGGASKLLALRGAVEANTFDDFR